MAERVYLIRATFSVDDDAEPGSLPSYAMMDSVLAHSTAAEALTEATGCYCFLVLEPEQPPPDAEGVDQPEETYSVFRHEGDHCEAIQTGLTMEQAMASVRELSIGAADVGVRYSTDAIPF